MKKFFKWILKGFAGTIGCALAVAFIIIVLGVILIPKLIPKEIKTKTVKLNENVQVGEVRWKVLEVKKTEAIEQEFGEPKKADGIFVIVKLEAELLGKESGNVSDSQLAIVDSQNRVFETNPEGEMALRRVKDFDE
ncbi:MAG: DUF4352 domain-containing protein, partial [Actinobacteria bacterium]|nr:DUF4352 domain-containing protein [Actinomycetota bacterium]